MNAEQQQPPRPARGTVLTMPPRETPQPTPSPSSRPPAPPGQAPAEPPDEPGYGHGV
jgi:hypothetical protein